MQLYTVFISVQFTNIGNMWVIKKSKRSTITFTSVNEFHWKQLQKNKKSNAESPLDGKHSEELVPFSRTKKSQPASNVRFTTNASFRQSPMDLKRGI